jgi:hypothetical protein
MTIKELYEWACENHIEDYDIYARTCDGCYIQVCLNNGDIEINNKDKEISLL